MKWDSLKFHFILGQTPEMSRSKIAPTLCPSEEVTEPSNHNGLHLLIRLHPAISEIPPYAYEACKASWAWPMMIMYTFPEDSLPLLPKV